MDWEYHVVDVFTQTQLEGNPLAVFPDARGLNAETMQRIAGELNLSETTFVLPAETDGAAARVRIFTPQYEMVFAGHPTIGTAFVLRERGLVARDADAFVLEEKVGPVRVRVDSGENPMIWLETPPITFGGAFDRAQCARSLGLTESDLLDGVPCRLVTAGNPNVYVALRDVATVDRAAVDGAEMRKLLAAEPEPTCVFVFTPTREGAYSRMFAPEHGVPEDPATGSATGPLAAFMMEYGLVATADGTRFVSEQGTKMGRRSLLHVLVRGERGATAIEVGGHVAPLARATLTLESAARAEGTKGHARI
ncbi:MAG: Phenazine biosynthesis PhzC/PhzF protein [Candidatus Eremiobacteraeota bacterium]|nr:Phenazine biosynthesis PhzC/PhzF protein [Candidatus Eremiobacteraeota bacterium]